MSIRFTCVKCGHHLKAHSKQAGHACHCPRCGQALTVPGAAMVGNAAPPSPEGRAAVRSLAANAARLLIAVLLVAALGVGGIFLALRNRGAADSTQAGPAPLPAVPEGEGLPSASDELLVLEDKQALPADTAEEHRVLGHGLKDIPASEVGLASPDLTPPPPAPPEPKPAESKRAPAAAPAPPKPADPPKPSPAPAAAPTQPPPRPAADVAFEERLGSSAEDLREQLRKVPELRLLSDVEIDAVRDQETAARLRPRARGVSPQSLNYAVNVQLHKVLRKAASKEGLPLQAGSMCLLDPTSGNIMQTLSKELRSLGFVSIPGVASRVRFPSGRVVNVRGTGLAKGSAPEKTAAFKEWCDTNHVEKLRGAFPTLLQMLQVEDEPTRLLLVQELEKVKNAATTAALVSRAIMDLSPKVRAAAVAALQQRPAQQYSSLLLRGLRYPWPPVADHAAVALVKLKPAGAAPQLVSMLDQPGPTKPMLDKRTGKRVVKELVRLNHMRNCLLCHAPSSGPQDGLVRAPVPTPGKPLPPAYYHERNAKDWVRADITFLRQDFSVCLLVSDSAPWPPEQRFDFVTRKRVVGPGEMPDVAAAPAGYPQRDAVLYALRGLTGKNPGDTGDGWRKALDIAVKPPPSAPARGKGAKP